MVKGSNTTMSQEGLDISNREANMTPNIISYKTFRQKTAFANAYKEFECMKEKFDLSIKESENVHDEVITKENYFEFYFENTRNKLFANY